MRLRLRIYLWKMHQDDDKGFEENVDDGYDEDLEEDKNMTINDCIVASYIEGFSGVYIYCGQHNNTQIADKFDELFIAAWNQAMDWAEEEYGAVCQEKEEKACAPAVVIRKKDWEKADRLHISVAPLYLSMNYGVRADIEYGENALMTTLRQLKKMYPELRYEGVIAYEYCDEHGGDVINYEISSEELPRDNTKTYDFIREILNLVLTDEDISKDFWENMTAQLLNAEEDDLNCIIRDFRMYGIGQEYLERLMEIAEECGLGGEDYEDEED